MKILNSMRQSRSQASSITLNAPPMMGKNEHERRWKELRHVSSEAWPHSTRCKTNQNDTTQSTVMLSQRGLWWVRFACAPDSVLESCVFSQNRMPRTQIHRTTDGKITGVRLRSPQTHERHGEASNERCIRNTGRSNNTCTHCGQRQGNRVSQPTGNAQPS